MSNIYNVIFKNNHKYIMTIVVAQISNIWNGLLEWLGCKNNN